MLVQGGGFCVRVTNDAMRATAVAVGDTVTLALAVSKRSSSVSPKRCIAACQRAHERTSARTADADAHSGDVVTGCGRPLPLVAARSIR